VLSNEYYQNELRKIYKADKKSGIDIIAMRGMPSSSIIETAAKYPNPLIIAGYKGVRPVAEFFFGSTAQALVLDAKIPVWIHRGNKIVKPEKVLIPHDLSVESNRSIDTVNELSLVTPFQYEVFFVQQRPYPILDYSTYTLAEKQLLKDTKAKVSKLKKKYVGLNFSTETGNVMSKISKKVKNFDIMVVAHHNPSGMFSSSATLSLLKKVNKPTLIVH
jgi:nucleotide-binding universal stress UspA family protein